MARVAIVTGGTRGIGEAISIALRDQGMKVAANYAGNEERAREFTERTGIPAYKWDVSDYEACQKGVAQVEAEVGPVDVLVNNAGITRDTTMKRMDHQKWQEVMDTNLGGCFNMAKAVWEGMTGRGYGRIVNIGSINGQAGQYGQVNYAAAKSGIHGFTKALAQEGARAGVTVNAIAPGYIDTDMVAAVPQEVLGRLSRAFRSTASAAPTKSPAAYPFWSMRMAGSSPARPCRSTAASTCIDERLALIRHAAEEVGNHCRPRDVDQPGADVLGCAGTSGQRRGRASQRADRRHRLGATGREAHPQLDLGDPAVAFQSSNEGVSAWRSSITRSSGVATSSVRRSS